MFLGTNKDNILDKNKKGRANASSGEKHFKHKLTNEDVIFIRSMDYDLKVVELADKFGVSVGTICSARSGRTWKNVPMGEK